MARAALFGIDSEFFSFLEALATRNALTWLARPMKEKSNYNSQASSSAPNLTGRGSLSVTNTVFHNSCDGPIGPPLVFLRDMYMCPLIQAAGGTVENRQRKEEKVRHLLIFDCYGVPTVPKSYGFP
jgi:hypothetical protein